MAIPNIEQRFLDAAGRIDVVWHRFLRELGPITDIAELQAAVAALQDALAAIGTPRDVIGQYSIQAIPGDGAYYLHLLGDTEEPGFTYYYGTGPDGLKGWYPVADTVEAAADELTKAVDAEGVVTFGLADVTPAVGGTLLLTTFDAKGRRSEEDDATAADLPYDNGTSGLAATDVQAAIDEVAASGGGGGGGTTDPRLAIIDPAYDMLWKPPTSASIEVGATYPWMLSYSSSTFSISSVNGGATAPGVWRLSATSSISRVGIAQDAIANITPGAGKITIPFRFRIPTLSDGTNTFLVRMGLAFDILGAGDFIIVDYAHNQNGGALRLRTNNAAGTNNINGTGAAVAANTWVSGHIEVNAAATQVDLYEGGTLIATSNPTGAWTEMALFAILAKSVGSTARTVDIDYLGPPQIEFTTPR